MLWKLKAEAVRLRGIKEQLVREHACALAEACKLWKQGPMSLEWFAASEKEERLKRESLVARVDYVEACELIIEAESILLKG